MEPSKKIKAVAQTYLQEQQLKEQAEYISMLEHTIEVIAEELGVLPQELINELNVMGALKTGGIGGAIKAFSANVKNRGLVGSLPLGNKSTERAIDSTVAKTEILKYKAGEERAKANPQARQIQRLRDRGTEIRRSVRQSGTPTPEQELEYHKLEGQVHDLQQQAAPHYEKASRMDSTANYAWRQANRIKRYYRKKRTK